MIKKLFFTFSILSLPLLSHAQNYWELRDNNNNVQALVNSSGTLQIPSVVASSDVSAGYFIGDGSNVVNLSPSNMLPGTFGGTGVYSFPDGVSFLGGLQADASVTLANGANLYLADSSLYLYDNGISLNGDFGNSGQVFESQGYGVVPVWTNEVWQSSDNVIDLIPNQIGDSTNVVVQTTMTVQGNAFSVGGSTFAVSNGNVGIGTNVPQGILDVEGAGSGNHPILFNSGNVGIGTDTPAYPLDVYGDVRSTGTFYGNGSGLTGIPSLAQPNTFTSTITVNAQDSNGYSAAFSSTIYLGAGGICYGSGSNCQYGPSSGGGGGLSPWTDSGDGFIAVSTPTNNVVIASTLTIQGNAFSVGGSTFVVINGEVGIGTSMPVAGPAGLEVGGAAIMDQELFVGGPATGLIIYAPAPATFIENLLCPTFGIGGGCMVFDTTKDTIDVSTGPAPGQWEALSKNEGP